MYIFYATCCATVYYIAVLLIEYQLPNSPNKRRIISSALGTCALLVSSYVFQHLQLYELLGK